MVARTVPIDFVRAAVTMAGRREVDTGSLLRSAGVAPELISQDRARVTVAQMTRTVQQLWRVTDDELFGLGPYPVPRGTLRLICFGLLGCPDLGSALDRFAEYQRLTPGLPPMAVTTERSRARFTIDTSKLDDPEHLVTAFLLAAAHRMMAWGIGRRIPLRQVEFPFRRPGGAADLGLVFGAPLAFESSTAALGFERSILSMPITQTEQTLLEWERNAPGDLLSRRDYGTALSEQVRRILARGRDGVWASAEEIAQRLAISPATVRRKLAAEGTSVTEIRADILRDAAIAGLVGGESVESLSGRLGFSESSAFRRAFRRWTGSPPGAYRAESGE
ncbi:AraC family transcriptional regulator ligand-binding domain-containing protein [Nocardia sp. NPDC051832]|uniref:AraC family transcriptional regulator n=1 Tax=Nocardia sp. NPDC051832 TaxID=3155673 RepID=UPI00343CBB71